MNERQVIHFVDADSRVRADLARVAFSLGHHAEVYADLLEICEHPPQRGIVVVRDDAEQGGVESAIELLGRCGIWLPVVATDEAPDTVRVVAAIKGGALDYLPLPLAPERFADMLGRIDEEARAHSEARRRMIEARGRIENLEAFVDGARQYTQEAEEPTLSGFLQEISLYSDQDALAGEQSNVTLMTIHNAKGLEFRAVFVVGVEEEIFPSARSIEEQGVEEERRLFYVGLTRAEERLTLTHASSRLLWGRTTSHLPSRFLDELPDRHVERERLRPSSWRSYGTPAQTREIAPKSDQPALATGDSVRHGTLGEGVITRIEPGGVVTVRFANDGSERKLMLDYAPLQKID